MKIILYALTVLASTVTSKFVRFLDNLCTFLDCSLSRLMDNNNRNSSSNDGGGGSNSNTNTNNRRSSGGNNKYDT